MPRYRWKARDAQGHDMSGEMAAGAEEQVVSVLRAQGIEVRSIDALDEGFAEGLVSEPALGPTSSARDQRPRAASRYASAFRGGLERIAAEARSRRSDQTL